MKDTLACVFILLCINKYTHFPILIRFELVFHLFNNKIASTLYPDFIFHIHLPVDFNILFYCLCSRLSLWLCPASVLPQCHGASI